jgi:hypothetical protein
MINNGEPWFVVPPPTGTSHFFSRIQRENFCHPSFRLSAQQPLSSRENKVTKVVGMSPLTGSSVVRLKQPQTNHVIWFQVDIYSYSGVYIPNPKSNGGF